MEDIFRALADPNRRALLDALHERDGQALGELETVLPGMTRFGVMKHLRVLADARLVTSRRDGRRKLHYLNPVPIQLIADRWISRFAKPWTTGIADLKATLEAPPPMSAPTHVYEVYIRTTPERLWQAITDPQLTRQYWHGALSHSTWEPGARWTSESADGEVYLDGEIVEIDPPRRLVQTFHVVHMPEAAADAPSRVTWEITPMGDACRLSILHEGMGPATAEYVSGGWATITSGLKTLLETGEPLTISYPEPAEANA
jgi:uncharacterized protein YndB with AHSA1/START domain/DNA-binding transcriptional ArsR family regulator